MSNFNVNRFGQNLGAGDNYANFAEYYENTVRSVFETPLVFSQFARKMSVAAGKTWHYPFRSRMKANRHTPGTLLTGSSAPITEDRTISVDADELVADVSYSSPDMKVANYDVIGHDARESAYSIRRIMDDHIARMCALGARQDARGTGDTEFKGGNLVRRNAANVAAAYPLSQTGSKNLQDDLGEMMQKFQEKDVESGQMACVITPYLMRVLLQDKTLTSSDWTAGTSNDLTIGFRINNVSGFTVYSTNRMPGAIDATDESQYQINCASTAALFFAHPEAVFEIQFGGLETEGPVWHDDRRSWLLQSAIYKGTKWIRPEACGELYVSTNAYTLSNGVFSPA